MEYIRYVKKEHPEVYKEIMRGENRSMIDDIKMIEITVKAPSGTGKSTIASHIAKTFWDMGFDVVVDDSDEIDPKFLEQERLNGILSKNLTISISTEQKPRSGEETTVFKFHDGIAKFGVDTGNLPVEKAKDYLKTYKKYESEVKSKISKGDVVVEKSPDGEDVLLFVATHIHDDWFSVVANVGNNLAIHRKLSFDSVEIVGHLNEEQFKQSGYDYYEY